MREKIQIFIRAGFALILTWFFVVGHQAMAQTAEPETVKAAPVEQAAQAPVQPVKDPASDVLESDVLETALDLDDPALLEALDCLLYTSPSPRDGLLSRMPSSA